MYLEVQLDTTLTYPFFVFCSVYKLHLSTSESCVSGTTEMNDLKHLKLL